ncbi:Domain of uncharacterised function (DUF1883) [Serratia rubidaea]|uniref:DUF1883 domain-containing protein n=1 Tax=Serratia rubidaea TaxID=61652 RepID=A0A448SCI1_SERRU|nr:DUF1883 domain-containing protein [Serratia rubidaea]AML56956.1 hypothetical protein AXX16_1235 [Serratia rubidaea]MBD8453661.1 DUF1883 domain-containing protein [Serratia rubidaea]MBH1930359.1 DUF1883 domain-containing protein [Serratia rubidaea]MBS0976146.1 DUF1883 domain-containing protein [Serratia rubidaea]MDC6109294.1 DUF1883 domain-containing protein [Serratia rubidaea]
MDFLHAQLHLKTGDVVEVHCDRPCTILLMDDAAFAGYTHGQPGRHHGGHCDELPARFTAPADGVWHVVIDAGQFNSALTHSINIYPVN